jgi:hypothetical protein
MIPLTLSIRLVTLVARKNLQSQQPLQILTLCRGFLTAPSPSSRDNENCGGTYETQHLAELQSNCMDSLVLCNSHSHPPQLVDHMFTSGMEILCNSSAKETDTFALQQPYWVLALCQYLRTYACNADIPHWLCSACCQSCLHCRRRQQKS